MEWSFVISIPPTKEQNTKSKVTPLLLGLPISRNINKSSREQLESIVSIRERGIWIHSSKERVPDFKIEWDQIVKIEEIEGPTRELKMDLINEEYITFKVGPIDKLYTLIKSKLNDLD